MPSSLSQAACVLALLTLAAMCVTAERIHGNSMYSGDVMDENERRRLFYERHGSYPDPKWVEREHPDYTRRMDQRTDETMQIMDHGKRWNEWMMIAQARSVPPFTPRQYDVIKVPESIHRKLYDNFHRMLPTAGKEGGEGRAVNGLAKFFPQEELNYEVQEELVPLFSEWAGVPVEPTAVYGVRVYQDGSTLDDHLDVLETHVISGILHIDSSLDEPFPIQLEDGHGVMASVNLQPGEMIFYESAKSYHQRSVPMKGRYYASIFIHYRPIGWNMSRYDIRLAIPPWWGEGLPGFEHAPRRPPKDGSLEVTFRNNYNYPVVLHWVTGELDADGKELMQALVTIHAGGTSLQNTHVAHVFIAVDEQGKFWERVPMSPALHGTEVHLGLSWPKHDEM